MKELLLKNWTLTLIVPLNLLSGLFLVNEVGELGIIRLIALILLSSYEIGIVRECCIRARIPDLLGLKKDLLTASLLAALLLAGVCISFQERFTLQLALFFMTSLSLNELKAYYDSKRRYDIGLLLRSTASIFLPWCILHGLGILVICCLIIALVMLRGVSKKLSQFEMERNRVKYTRFGVINLLSIVGGNVEKMILGILVSRYSWITTFLLFGEYNRRAQSIFGFLTPLILFGHIKIGFKFYVYVAISLFVSLSSICYYYNLGYMYIVYSISTGVIIFSQFIIYNKLRETNKYIKSYFGLIGMFLVLIGILLTDFIGVFNFWVLVLVLITKTIVETLFVQYGGEK